MSFAGAQSTGKRDYQEDVFLTRVLSENAHDAGVIALVADGMGGHVAGALAADIASNAFMAEAAGKNGVAANRFISAIDIANKAIAREITKTPDVSGMGCTMLAIEVRNGSLNWVSVGDSILYLISGNTIRRLNADHSLAPQIDAAAARGEMTLKEARTSNQRHVLRSALTGGVVSLVDVSRSPQPLKSGDWILVASDGIAALEEDDLLHLIDEVPHKDAAAICSKILAAVENKSLPHQDNTTIVALNIIAASEQDQDDVPTRPIPSN